MAKREGQAYVPNSTKTPAAGKAKYSIPEGGGKAPNFGDQSKAEDTKPSMQPAVPEGPWSIPVSGGKAPDFGTQSMAPDHKKKSLPHQNAPVGTKGVNEGSDYPLPKSGGKGETEV